MQVIKLDTKSKERSAKIQNLLKFTKHALGSSICLGVFIFTVAEIQNSILLDFEIYYEAGQSLLNGASPYQFYGNFLLPFQYFPWISWMFVPLALIPMQTAWIVYAFINIGLLYLAINILVGLIPKNEKNILRLRTLYIFFASLMMCLLVFIVGQISIVLLFICAVVIKLIHDNKPEMAGLLTPFLLIKPHLMLIFLPHVLLRGGKRLAVFSILGTAILAGIATIQNPDWVVEMINIILSGQSRGDDLLWGFSTLPGALELKNWRLANFYFALPSLVVSILILGKLYKLPHYSQLLSSLALSIFSAPYSFAYDLPLIIPALIYLSNTHKTYFTVIWLCAAILPLILKFQGQTYILIFATVSLIFLEIIKSAGKGIEKNEI